MREVRVTTVQRTFSQDFVSGVPLARDRGVCVVDDGLLKGN